MLTYAANQPFESHEWQIDPLPGVGYRFLNGAGTPNIVGLNTPGLRVSDNGLFAVEDADLTRRQPKHFFADLTALDEWNKSLARQGSYFQLFPDPPATVTFLLPGDAAPRTLTRVRVANLQTGRAGNAMTMAENCDVAVQEVIGSQLTPLPVLTTAIPIGSTPAHRTIFEYHVANHLVGAEPRGDLTIAPAAAVTAAQEHIAQFFGEDTGNADAGRPITHNRTIVNDMRAVGVNRFAQPTRVGQGLYTASLGPSRPHIPAGREVTDHRTGTVISDPVTLNRVLWGFHWGGVVAVDGTDHLTLENYARNGENTFGQGASLFYVQMYGANRTWHDEWTRLPMVRGKTFANPITLVVQPDGARPLTYFINGSKNQHAAVAAATNEIELQRALLNGLNYATVHLYATSLTTEYADRDRRAAWIAQLDNLLLARPGWATPPTFSLAEHVRTALNAVKTPPKPL
ncbi:hypothetical protein ACIQWB_37035 [Streptomyces olivaceus]|uniref:hypothetical protein n=1 Tax=Streptomyces olivaceus TaxID=47716 RepID=UPI0037F31B6E